MLFILLFGLVACDNSEAGKEEDSNGNNNLEDYPESSMRNLL